MSNSQRPPTSRWHEPMGLALDQARAALRADDPQGRPADVPIGAVLLGPDGEVIGRGHNRREVTHDPTAHAEVLAIREASAALGRWRLDDCALVVTLEPCAMCAGAILLARIPVVVIGAWDEKAGATGSVWDIVRDPRMNHFAQVISGVREQECSALLTYFFASRR